MPNESELTLIRRGVEELISLFTAQQSALSTLTEQLQSFDVRLVGLEKRIADCHAESHVLADAATYARAELEEANKRVEAMYHEWAEAGRPYRQREPSSPESPRSIHVRDTEPVPE